MKMRKGEKWICSNPTCRTEIVVTVAGGPEDGANPRCCCGSRMKKVYAAPKFSSIQNPEHPKAVDIRQLFKVR
jgi:hypothetical protein